MLKGMPAPNEITRLVFVFNADSGKLNALVDSAKKLLMINGCSLCTITHGLAGEKGSWKECKEELGLPVDYVHRDELTPRMVEVIADRFPAVLAETGDGALRMLLTPDVLDRCKGSVADLRGRLRTNATMTNLTFPTPI